MSYEGRFRPQGAEGPSSLAGSGGRRSVDLDPASTPNPAHQDRDQSGRRQADGHRSPPIGGGLALAAGMSASGLADWLGQALLPLESWPLVLVAIVVVAMVVLITEFASNVATASGIIPVVASLTVALGVDPVLLAMPAALAASWGFMLPAGTGPNAIAWSTGRIRIERMVKAGILLDLVGIFMIVAVVWGIAAIV